MLRASAQDLRIKIFSPSALDDLLFLLNNEESSLSFS